MAYNVANYATSWSLTLALALYPLASSALRSRQAMHRLYLVIFFRQSQHRSRSVSMALRAASRVLLESRYFSHRFIASSSA